jgi:redox-sensitive bicupin YhaK (pirin superfamily)
MTVQRAADRYTSELPGVRSSHSFSAGAHYDAGNVGFGSLVGVDEHVLDAGAGFDRHAHRNVAIVTWVLDGVLRHEDSTGAVHLVEPGTVALQITGRGIEHVETNASTSRPAHFVQTTILCDDDEPSYRLAASPVLVGTALFDVHRAGPLLLEAARMHLFVASGEFSVEGRDIHPGDTMRITQEPPRIDGSGELLVLLLR